jgi:hypothetical protein
MNAEFSLAGDFARSRLSRLQSSRVVGDDWIVVMGSSRPRPLYGDDYSPDDY